MDTQTAESMLRSRGWLRLTPVAFQNWVLTHCNWRHFASGDAITNAGSESGEIFGVAAGIVALSASLGPPDSAIATLVHPGYWFGFVPLLTGRPRIISSQARSSVVIACVPQIALERHLAAQPTDWRYMALLAQESAELAVNIAVDSMIRDSRRRCIAALLRVAECRFATSLPLPIDVQVSQDDLASLANLSRSTTNLILAKLEAERLMTRGYTSITLHNPDALRAIVDADG